MRKITQPDRKTNLPTTFYKPSKLQAFIFLFITCPQEIQKADAKKQYSIGMFN